MIKTTKFDIPLLCLFILGIFAYPSTSDRATDASWKRSMVQHSLDSTTVVYLITEDGAWMGSGVVINSEGLTLTAAHVVNHTSSSMMQTYKGQSYAVRVLFIDKYKDLALIQPIASGKLFSFCKIQPSDDVYVGQAVLVVGHPEEQLYTVTSGIITRLVYYWWIKCNVIETNAGVDHGSSGGPMLNTDGQVIGIISTMKTDIKGRPLGIGIAVSIDEIHKFITKYNKLQNKPTQIKRYTIGELKP